MRKLFPKSLFYLSLLFTTLSASHTQPRNIDFSTVISGGVSLGAYESGYNWAMIKMLNTLNTSPKWHIRPNLRSIAGASAGSINALLTATYWCQKPSASYQNTVEDNLFFETWVNLGLEDLIIKGSDPHNKSTLFSRKALRKKADKIMAHLEKPVFKEECSVPIGFTVTKVTPIVENYENIPIKNQNFSVPFDFTVHQGKVTIRNKTMPEKSTLFYLSIPGIKKDYTRIVNVLFASSAFPGAFEQVKLRYAYKGRVRESYFIDGGVYDNIPLGLATVLNPKANNFLLIDPNNMRKEPPSSDEDEEEPPIGFFSSSLIPMVNSVEILQQMKLYQAINRYFRRHPERKLILSSRYHPLTAGFLEHFGAFLDRNFRLYDYHVGVYDAIYQLADKLGKIGIYNNLSQPERMDLLMKKLNIDKNKEAYTAYRFFRATEFHLEKPDRNNRYGAIYYAFDRKLPDSKRYSADAFKTFLGKLDMRYLPVKKGTFLYYARKDVDNWYKRPLRYLVDRVTYLENERAKVYPGYKPTAKVMGLGAWLASGMLKEQEGWDILPINAPYDPNEAAYRNILRFIPTELSVDTVNGGFSLAYEGYWYHKLGFLNGLDFKASYNVHKNDGDFVRFDADAFSEYNDFLTVGGGVSAFGNIEHRFYDRDTAYGGNVYLDVMDIFRMTYVYRHGNVQDNNYLYFGIENLPSLIYWLSR